MTGPRRVLVTGAGKRIGAGLSVALAEAGWHVVLHYNQAAKEAQALCETLAAAGESVELVQAIWPSRVIMNDVTFKLIRFA